MLKKACIVAAAVAGLLTAGGPAFASSCSSHHIGGSCRPHLVGDDAPLINVSDITVSDIDVALLGVVSPSGGDCCSTTKDTLGFLT